MKKRIQKKSNRKDMREPRAEGMAFPFEAQNKIKAALLQALPYKGTDQNVQYRTSEFSAVCPFSGLPDIGTVIIEYVPRKLIVELRSLKYYFISFRNVGIYQEDATNRIFNDLYSLLKPKQMKVTTIYSTRGGIDSTCVIEKGRKRA